MYSYIFLYQCNVPEVMQFPCQLITPLVMTIDLLQLPEKSTIDTLMHYFEAFKF